MKVDPAILEALGLSAQEAEDTTVTSHGGSGFASTLKVVCGNKKWFVKQGKGKESEIMFLGEYTSLNTIHSAVPTLCPRALAHGTLSSNPNTHFLITEFIDFWSSSSSSASINVQDSETLVQKLARLHTTPAPNGPNKYGFDVITCCGRTAQDNTYEDDWAKFFAERRLRNVARECPGNVREWVEKICGTKQVKGDVNLKGSVVEMLLGRMKGEGVNAVCCHGDLWSGNKSVGTIVGRETNDDKGRRVEEVVFDPSGVYAPAEYDAGIMQMFGGFTSTFWNEYHKLVPKAEPFDEYDDRVKLYGLYHQLNHCAMFGGGYGSTAISIMKDLWNKYGGDA